MRIIRNSMHRKKQAKNNRYRVRKRWQAQIHSIIKKNIQRRKNVLELDVIHILQNVRQNIEQILNRLIQTDIKY